MPYSMWELYGIVTSASIVAFLQPEKPPNSLGKRKGYREFCGNFLGGRFGVSKNRGTPKWMVYNGKPLLKWMIWGYHYFRKHPDPFSAISSCNFIRLCLKKTFALQASNNKIPPHERCTKFSG